MELATNLLIAVGLAMDAMAVSLGIGTTGMCCDPRSKFRLSFHFGLFQMGMALIGWLAGSTIVRFISSVDHWVALALLVYVGGNMIRSGFDGERTTYPANPSRGRLLIILSVATSLDALAVGLSMAMLKSPILVPSILIGVVTAGLSLLGLLAGNRLGQVFGKRMEILGGLILVAIGLRILFTHIA